MGDEFNGTISLGRKLSEEEAHELRITLLPYFHSEGGMETDDINDFLDYTFTMLANDKTVEYIVGEYVAFFSPEVSQKIGKQLAIRINELKGGDDGRYADEGQKSDIVTTQKSGGEARGNALTMSGALGASREGGRSKKDEKKEHTGKKDEGRVGKDKDRGDRREGKRGRGTERTSETFDRLAKGRDDRGRGRGREKGQDSREDGRRGRDKREDGRRGRDSREDGRTGEDREDGRDGRGGRGQGRGRDIARELPRDLVPRGGPRDMGPRGGPRDMGPRGGPRDMVPRGGPRDMGPRGGPRGMDPRGGRDGGRFGRGDRGPQRRSRDEFEEEPDYVPAAEGRGGRGGVRGRGFDGPKRPRYDESYEEGHDHGGYGGYDDGYEYYPPMRGGRGRGRVPGRGRFGRGRGYDGGEGAASWGDSGGHEAAHGEGSGEGESSLTHPSPMVRASFGGRGGFGGVRGRGFIRGGAGRGRFGGREQIVSMIQSKTWVRKKDGEDSGGGGDAGAAES